MTDRYLAFLVASLGLLGAATGSVPAQDKSVRPGINKPFESPDVKGFIGKFEGESREVFSQRKEIVAACRIRPGMAVADIGAGTGLFSRLFAREVGPNGKVYAVDIAPDFVKHVESTCEKSGIKNVVGVVCAADNVRLPPRSIDLAFICDTYHHFEFPYKTMASIHQALRPGGRVIVIDFHRIAGKSRAWVLNHVRAGQEVVTKEIESAGFKSMGEESLLKENYLVKFKKIEATGSRDEQERIVARAVIIPKDVVRFTVEKSDLVRLAGRGIVGSKVEAKVEGPARITAIRILRELKNGRPLIGSHAKEFELAPTGTGKVRVTLTVTPPQPDAKPLVTTYQFEVK
ncbi:MAG: class I SAM-dependent methyltransferase [Planctomycetes bacterium]|nr:class I SAM-dependent methyltransferase [Planctomycetota bacterium]